MNEPTPPTRPVAHAHMPRFATWVQDNLLLPLLMIASGYVNGIMLTTGWVPDIENPDSWGLFHGIGIPILFAAGLALGGLAVRISFKAAECLVRKQYGRMLFMVSGIILIVGVEFWASFSQRALNLRPTAADTAVLSAFDLRTSAVSLTAILIAVVIPLASLFWGFAADDPTPKPVEATADLETQFKNEELRAKHKARLAKIRAQGVRGAVGAVFSGDEEDAQPVVDEAPAFASVTPRRKSRPIEPAAPPVEVPATLRTAIKRGRAAHVQTSADDLLPATT